MYISLSETQKGMSMSRKSDEEIERMLRGESTRQEVEQEQFQKIREHIRNNPGATADEIADATGIDERVIFRFISSGKLVKR